MKKIFVDCATVSGYAKRGGDFADDGRGVSTKFRKLFTKSALTGIGKAVMMIGGQTEVGGRRPDRGPSRKASADLGESPRKARRDGKERLSMARRDERRNEFDELDELEERRPKRGGAFVTFLLVLIILFLSGVLIYLRYGDLIMNRVYQFTGGKYGAETGVTAQRRDTWDGSREETESGPDGDGNADGETGADTNPDGAATPDPVVTEPEPVAPSPTELDYAAANALPDGIALSTHDFTLRTLGESATVRVTGGSEGPFAWISQDPSVAAVDADGKITAKSHGTVNVIVTDGVRKGVCVARMITGTTSTEAKLNATDFTRTVEEGEYQLKVTGVEAPITWTSENPSVASVDADGLVTPLSKGRARIRASWDGGYLICVVRVPE